jgi:hypothetical protein
MRNLQKRLATLEGALLPEAGSLPSSSLEILKQVVGRLTTEHLELLSSGLKAKRDGRPPTDGERAAQRALDILFRRESRCARPNSLTEFLPSP